MSAAHLKDEPLVSCPACGAENRIGRLFCTQCGAPMHQGGEPPKAVRRKSPPKVFHALRNALLALGMVLVVVCGGLVLWPFHPAEHGGEARGREGEVGRIIQQFSGAIENRRYMAPQVITEDQVNEYVRGRADEDQRMRVSIEADRIVVTAAEPWLVFTRSTRVVLMREGREEPFRVERVRLGHLPVPRGLAGPVIRGLAERFDLDVSPEIWEYLAVLNAERRRAVVGFAPRGEGDGR